MMQSPLSTLSSHIHQRCSALVSFLRPLSDLESNQAMIVDAVIRLQLEKELRQTRSHARAVKEGMGVLWQQIVANQPELGELMTQLSETSELRARLLADIDELENQKPPVSNEDIREAAMRIQALEDSLVTQQTKCQLRYTKAKADVDAIVNSMAYIHSQINNYNKRIQLMQQNHSNYSHKTQSHHQEYRMPLPPIGLEADGRPNSAGAIVPSLLESTDAAVPETAR
jgi:chromosome segregation ATPase